MKQIQPVFLAMKFSFLIFFFFSLPVGAQSIFQKYGRFLTEPRSYVCYRTDGKLKIDGKLDEASWQKAKPTAPFVDISGEGFPTPKYETTAKMLWDDEYLYIGAVLQEDDIKARLTQRDTIIYYDNDFNNKSMLIKVTDQELLNLTGGIIQRNEWSTNNTKRKICAEQLLMY